MPKAGVKELALAKVYAAAIFEVGQSTGQIDQINAELRSLGELVNANPEFETFLDSPAVDSESRKLTVEKLFRSKYSDVLTDSLQILNRKERLGIVGEVAAAYHALHQESLGRVELHVSTPVALSDELREQLRERIARATGKQIDLVERIDSSLIGGIVLQLGDKKFDGSVRRKLAAVNAALLERSSRELYAGKTYASGTA